MSWMFFGLVRLFGVLLGQSHLALLVRFLDWTTADLEVQSLVEREAFVQVRLSPSPRLRVLDWWSGSWAKSVFTHKR